MNAMHMPAFAPLQMSLVIPMYALLFLHQKAFFFFFLPWGIRSGGMRGGRRSMIVPYLFQTRDIALYPSTPSGLILLHTPTHSYTLLHTPTTPHTSSMQWPKKRRGKA